MGKSKQTQTQDSSQQFAQQQTQDQSQEQRQLQMQQQATEQLSQLLQSFYQTGTSQQQQQQASTAQTGQQSTQQQTGGTTTTTGLSPLQQPVAQKYFEDLMQRYVQGSLAPQAYTGERVAPLTTDQLAAQNMMRAYAGGPGTEFSNDALTANRFLMDPTKILNPSAIPGYQASNDAMIQSMTRNLTENILPNVRTGHSLVDAYGGSRQDLSEGLAVGRTQDSIASALAQKDLGMYQQGLQAMQNAIGLAPTTAAGALLPATTVGQVGAQNQQQSQAVLNANQAQFREEQAVPGTTLALLQSLMGNQGQYGGQAATTSQAQATTNATGTSSEQATGTTQATQATSGQSQQTQIAQVLASMLGINLGDMTAHSTGSTSGTQTGKNTTTQISQSSPLQVLGALAGLAMMPFTFGLTGPGAAAAAAPVGMAPRNGSWG